MPILETAGKLAPYGGSIATPSGSARVQAFSRVGAIQVDGGQVLAVRNGPTVIWTSVQNVIRGRVIAGDSAPQPGARVFLRELARAATTDGSGRFEFATLLPGEYTLAATTALRDSLDIDPIETRVRVDSSGVAHAVLRVPSAYDVLRDRCAGAAEDSALTTLHLTLADSISHAPLANVSVQVTWSQYITGEKPGQGGTAVAGHRVGTTDAHGRVLLCGIPKRVPISVQATLRDGPSRSTSLTMRRRGVEFVSLWLR